MSLKAKQRILDWNDMDWSKCRYRSGRVVDVVVRSLGYRGVGYQRLLCRPGLGTGDSLCPC